MRPFTAFTSVVLTVLVTYSLILLVCAKVAGIQLRPESLSELGHVEFTYIVLLLGLATIFITLVSVYFDGAIICAAWM